jgi:hypothetical protein
MSLQRSFVTTMGTTSKSTLQLDWIAFVVHTASAVDSLTPHLTPWQTRWLQLHRLPDSLHSQYASEQHCSNDHLGPGQCMRKYISVGMWQHPIRGVSIRECVAQPSVQLDRD